MGCHCFTNITHPSNFKRPSSGLQSTAWLFARKVFFAGSTGFKPPGTGRCKTRRQFVCNSTINWNDVRTDSVEAVKIGMSILYRHYVDYGLYLLLRKVNIHLSHTHTYTRNLTKIYFFLLLWNTYRHWLTVCWVGRPKKYLLEHCSIHYTLTREHTEYMMATILSNRWGSHENICSITRHCTCL